MDRRERIVRMDHEGWLMCQSITEGRRRTERPRLRWLEEAERDLRELKLKMATKGNGQWRRGVCC
jgi:hypothetical protein